MRILGLATQRVGCAWATVRIYLLDISHELLRRVHLGHRDGLHGLSIHPHLSRFLAVACATRWAGLRGGRGEEALGQRTQPPPALVQPLLQTTHEAAHRLGKGEGKGHERARVKGLGEMR